MKISLVGSSLRRRFLASPHPLRLLDLPRVARQEFDLRVLELDSPFFLSRDKAYLTELDEVAMGEGVELLNILVEGAGDLCSPDREARQRAIEAHAVWLPVAAHLGCRAIRVPTGGVGREKDRDALLWCVDAYLELAQRASRTGVMVLIENGEGISAHPDQILHIIEQVDSPWLGTLADFGNFAAGTDRYEGLEKLMPYAASVHAQVRDFDERGLETVVDVPRCYRIVQRAGFDGHVGIEFVGEGSDHDGVMRAKQLLERCLAGEFPEEKKAARGIGKTVGAVRKIPGLRTVTGGLRKISALKRLGRARSDGHRSAGS